MGSSSRLVAVGISHHTANLEERERVAVAPDGIPNLLDRLKQGGLSNEALLLSTCNRTELYAVQGHQGSVDKLVRFLAESGGVTDKAISDKIYRKCDQEALRHIFRVASSLDSLVLGEPQIVSQLKGAFRIAQQNNVAGPVLHRVMDHAMSVSKRVRSETDISREAVSVGRAGVELAKQVLGELEGRSALLVGAGAHGKVVARTLLEYGLDELVVANRTFSRAADLANHFNGSAIPLQEVDRYLPRVDVVLCSTGAGRTVINRGDVEQSVSKRRGRSLVMIDLAVPRNIDPLVNEISGVFRFDIDDLAQFAGRGKAARRDAAAQAEEIVDQATKRHWKQLMGDQVNHEMGRIVRSAEAVRQAEMSRISDLLDGLPEDQVQSVDAMTRAIVKKILHQPLKQVRSWAEDGDAERAKVLFSAFKNNDDDD